MARGVNSREISFPGLKAQIPGLVSASIWTVVIRLAKQWQRVCQGLAATAGRLADPTGPTAAAAPRRSQVGSGDHPAAATMVLSQVDRPPRGDVAKSPGWHRGGSLMVKVRRLLSCCPAPASTTGPQPATTVNASWVVAGQFANAIVNSDASCLLHRPTEVALDYTARPDVLYRLIAVHSGYSVLQCG